MEKHQRASINCSWPSGRDEESTPSPLPPIIRSAVCVLHVVIASSTTQSLEISHSFVASRFSDRSSLFAFGFVNTFSPREETFVARPFQARGVPLSALHQREPRSRNLIRIPDGWNRCCTRYVLGVRSLVFSNAIIPSELNGIDNVSRW